MDTLAFTPPLQQWSLHCPQIPFKNRFGFYSAFHEMNPAVYYDTTKEEWIVLVRGVNYEKLSNNTYALFASPAHSVYWIAHGPSLDTLHFIELQWDYQLPTYGSYWNGIEDARFLDRRRILVTVPQLDPRGQPTMFCATLNESLERLTDFKRLEPSEKPEKNWMPMPGGDSVIYGVNPFQCKSLHSKELITIPLTPTQQELLDGFHGSTNGIPWMITDSRMGQLYLIHKTIDTERGPHTTTFFDTPKRVVHRWLFLEKTGTIMVTPPFVFFKHSYIEFPCSLVKYSESRNPTYGESLFVSLGLNDMHALILRVKPPSFSS